MCLQYFVVKVYWISKKVQHKCSSEIKWSKIKTQKVNEKLKERKNKTKKKLQFVVEMCLVKLHSLAKCLLLKPYKILIDPTFFYSFLLTWIYVISLLYL